jgi:hypothetical protein
MTLSLVFNDLSLRCPAPDIHTARNRMTEFVETLKTAAVHNVTVLRMRDNFKDFALCPEYPMGAWFGDNSVSRDEREFVLAYATQYSFIRPYDGDLRGDEEFPSDRWLFEGRFGDERAEGLGFAYLLKGLALSILSETCWDTPWLDLDCKEFNSESDEIEESRVVLRHVSRIRHVSDDHAAWIEERIRDGICTGFDLLRVANARFPRMVFCNDARKQIEALTESSMQLPRVRERLFELGQLIDAWEQGRFNYHQIHNASEESPSTIGRYGDRREFVCPDGQRRLFSWHLKGLPQMWRIHIWADQEERNVLIGYVGKHLPTVRNPT